MHVCTAFQWTLYFPSKSLESVSYVTDVYKFLSYEIFPGGINKYSEEVLSWNSGKELLIPVKRHNFSKCAQFNEYDDGAPQMLHSSLPSQW